MIGRAHASLSRRGPMIEPAMRYNGRHKSRFVARGLLVSMPVSSSPLIVPGGIVRGAGAAIMESDMHEQGPELVGGHSPESDALVDKLRLSRKTLAEVLDYIKTIPGSADWWSGDDRNVWIEKTEKQLADIDRTIGRYDTR